MILNVANIFEKVRRSRELSRSKRESDTGSVTNLSLRSLGRVHPPSTFTHSDQDFGCGAILDNEVWTLCHPGELNFNSKRQVPSTKVQTNTSSEFEPELKKITSIDFHDSFRLKKAPGETLRVNIQTREKKGPEFQRTQRSFYGQMNSSIKLKTRRNLMAVSFVDFANKIIVIAESAQRSKKFKHNVRILNARTVMNTPQQNSFLAQWFEALGIIGDELTDSLAEARIEAEVGAISLLTKGRTMEEVSKSTTRIVETVEDIFKGHVSPSDAVLCSIQLSFTTDIEEVS